MIKQMEIDILNLENRLLQEQKNLNDIIYQCETEKTSEIINAKIDKMKADIDYMSHQIAMLKMHSLGVCQSADSGEDITNVNVIREAERPFELVQQNIVNNNIELEKQGQATQYDSAQSNINPNMTNTNSMRQNNNASIDYEKLFGKSWMGAIAAVLVLISIVMFATLLMPVLTDGIKLMAMYAVSIGFTVVGFKKMQKDKSNSFYKALGGCGIAAIYITMLLSNIYFKVINDIVLYLLILVWAVVVCILNREKSRLFQVIGQFGILISVFFGNQLCIDKNDYIKYFVLIVFYVITSLMFIVFHRKETFKDNVINLIFNNINVWILVFGLISFDDIPIMVMIASLFILGYAVFTLYVQYKSTIVKTVGFGILCCSMVIQILCCMVVTFMTLNEVVRNTTDVFEIIYDILAIIVCILVLVCTEKKIANKYAKGRIIIQLVMISLIAFFASVCDLISEEVAYILVGLGVLIYGFIKDDNVYKFSSLIYMSVIYLISDIEGIEYAFALIYYGVLFTLSVIKKLQYNRIFKLLSYISAVLFVNRFYDVFKDLTGSREAAQAIVFMIIALSNMFAIRSFGVKNWITGEIEKINKYVINAIHIWLMIISLVYISDMRNVVCHVLVICTALGLYCVNIKNTLQTYKGTDYEGISGVYVALKMTMLFVVILGSFDVANLIISISCFILAIAFIIVGFGLKVKVFRIYGLVLSMLSLAKLILIDINYDDLVGRAIGFFVCGILCFVISMIYNTINKKMND